MLNEKDKDNFNEHVEEPEGERNAKLSKEEIKDGWKYLVNQGKVFKLFLLMVGYFLFIDMLGVFGVINGLWVLILIVPVIFVILAAYIVYMNKHGDDEMK